MNAGRTRAREQLLARSDRFLADNGLSRELLELGNRAWPWRVDDGADGRGILGVPGRVTASSRIEATAVGDLAGARAELERCSDADLADLGIARADIGRAVAEGRPGIDRAAGSEREAA